MKIKLNLNIGSGGLLAASSLITYILIKVGIFGDLFTVPKDNLSWYWAGVLLTGFTAVLYILTYFALTDKSE